MSKERELVSFTVCGNKFEVDSKYKLIKPVGKGAYGTVCSAYTSDNEKIAIKKIANAFENRTDTKRTLRELKLLRFLQHENIILVKDVLRPIPDCKGFQDVYIVSELMDTDLHQIIASHQELTDDHIQYFIYQVLRGLKFIHSANVLHRDLKPSNLLLNENCDLKICDFGLARLAEDDSQNAGLMTEYVATRWYRAPEIILAHREYTKAVDIWSVGCIFAELLGRRPLFPGRDYIHQLDLIVSVLGSPTDEDLAFIKSEKPRKYLKAQPKRKKVPFETLFPNATPEALRLLERMLQFNPAHRCTVEEALSDPYLESLHDPEDEPTCSSHFNFNWEHEELTVERLRDLILEEMVCYHPELKPEVDVYYKEKAAAAAVAAADGEGGKAEK